MVMTSFAWRLVFNPGIILYTSKSKSPRLAKPARRGEPRFLTTSSIHPSRFYYCTQVLLKLVSTLAAAAMVQTWFVPVESVLLKSCVADWLVLPFGLRLRSHPGV